MKYLLGLFSFCCAFVFCAGCSSGSSDYFFERPAAFTTVSGTLCSNNRTSYTAFVVDNTKKYGARIKKISGCEKKIDKSLKDKRDKKRGIYVGGTGVSMDKIVSEGKAVVAVASTGQVLADHWKDNKKESMHLDSHKGRIVLRRFTGGIEHDKDFNRSFILDFYPEIVKSYEDEGFFFSGSDFAAYYIGFVDIEGKGSWVEIDFPVSEIAVIGKKVYLFDDLTGTVYTTDKDLKPEEAAVFDDFKEGHMSRLYGGKLAFFKENRLKIFDAGLNCLHTLKTPEGFDISAVNVFPYSSNYKYRKFTDTKSSEDEDSSADEDVPENEDMPEDEDSSADEDVPENEDVSEKVQVYKKDLTDEEKEELSNENKSVSSSWETVDAESGDIIWIAMKNGFVRAYDFTASSWLVEPFDSAATSTYELEMRPYLAASYSYYPKNSVTTSDNAPFIESVKVVRGLPAQMTYRFIYEGIFDGTFSKGNYTVTREALGRQVFVGNAVELGSADSEDSFSFEDEFVSVAIRRADDSFETEPETSFYITVGQGIPFVGFSSADVMTEIESPARLRFLGFSSVTRRFVEYDMAKDKVEEVYK